MLSEMSAWTGSVERLREVLTNIVLIDVSTSERSERRFLRAAMPFVRSGPGGCVRCDRKWLLRPVPSGAFQPGGDAIVCHLGKGCSKAVL